MKVNQVKGSLQRRAGWILRAREQVGACSSSSSSLWEKFLSWIGRRVAADRDGRAKGQKKGRLGGDPLTAPRRTNQRRKKRE